MRPIVDLGKTTALTHALWKLCNYYIEENDLELYEQAKMDMFSSAISGSIPIEDDGSGNLLPK